MDNVTMTFLIIGGLGLAVLAVAGFVGAFGFTGSIAGYLAPGGTTTRVIVACAAGMVAALPTGWLAMRLSRLAMHMRTDATPTRADLVGTLGVVGTRVFVIEAPSSTSVLVEETPSIKEL